MGRTSSDLNILVIFGLAIPLVFDIIPFVEFRRIMAMFPFLAGLIGIEIFLGITSDGSITTGSGGSISYILSASTTSSTWIAVTLTLVILALVGFLLSIYVVLKGN